MIPITYNDFFQQSGHGKDYSVKPMHYTFAGFLGDIRNAVKAGGDKKISYRNRVNDTAGNAKESFVFDIRKLHLLRKKN